MKWTKLTDVWECVFVNVPFKVRVWPNGTAQLFFCIDNKQWSIHIASYRAVEEAKADVNNFVLGYLASCSDQVHRECLEANTMTWRKLKEQLDEIPEEQLDEEVKVLDTAIDWCGVPSIVKAEDNQYKNDDAGHDVEGLDLDYCNYSVVVEKGHYYLHTKL